MEQRKANAIMETDAIFLIELIIGRSESGGGSGALIMANVSLKVANDRNLDYLNALYIMYPLLKSLSFHQTINFALEDTVQYGGLRTLKWNIRNSDYNWYSSLSRNITVEIYDQFLGQSIVGVE